MWADILNQFHDDAWRAFLFDGALKVTAVLLGGLLLAAALRRHSAAARHFAWLLTFIAIAVTPLGMLLLPGWGPERTIAAHDRTSAILAPQGIDDGGRNPVRPAFADPLAPEADKSTSIDLGSGLPAARDDLIASTAETVGEEFSSSRRNEETGSPDHPAVIPATSATRSSTINVGRPLVAKWSITLLEWLPAIWLTGSLAALVPLVVGGIRVHRLRRRSRRLASGDWPSLVAALADGLRLRRTVELRQTPGSVGPLAGGIVRPFVMLPPECDLWPDDRRRVVLLHELAHIRRHDVLMLCLTRVICAAYWFHPLVWHAARRLRIESERACDDVVLAAGTTPSDYSRHLVTIAAACRSPRWVAASAMTMAPASPLEDRIGCILDERRSRKRLSIVATAGLTLTLSALATAVATAGRVIVRDAEGRTIAEVALPAGGSVTVHAAPISVPEPAGAAPAAAQEDPATVGDQPAGASDWPQWGGSSHRNNVSPARGLPADWDAATGRNVCWTAPLGSTAYGGVVVSGNKVIVGTNNGHGYVGRHPATIDLGCLLCFDRGTGKFLWQHSSEKLPTGRVHDWPELGIVSTPCVVRDRLWYVTNRCVVVCLDTEGFRDGENDGLVVDEEFTGESDADVVWAFDMLGVLGVSPHNVSACSPTTDGERLFIVTGNGVDESHAKVPAPHAPDFICLDLKTGQLLWKDHSVGERVLHGSWSSPAYGVLRGRPQVLMPGGDGWLYSFDPAGDGQGGSKLLWKFDCNPKDAKWGLGPQGRRNAYLTTPVIWNDKVYVATGNDPELGEGAADLWCIDPPPEDWPFPGAKPHLMDLSEHAVRKWTPVELKLLGARAEVAKASAWVPPRREQNLDEAAGEELIPNPRSRMVWHYTGQDLNGDGKQDFDESFHRCLGSPAIDDGLLFIADLSGIVHCLDANTGRPHWTHDLLSANWSTPLIEGGRVLIGNEDGTLTVFGLSPDKQVVAAQEFDRSISNTVVAAGDTLFVIAKDRLLAIGRSGPEPQDARQGALEGNDRAWNALGLKLSRLDSLNKTLEVPSYRGGMVVSEVRRDGPAERNGIRVDDILVGLHVWETATQENVDFVLHHPDIKTFLPLKFYIIREKETLYGYLRTVAQPSRILWDRIDPQVQERMLRGSSSVLPVPRLIQP